MYRVLYRKWRPMVFSDVIGQPQVTVTLSSQIKENRLSHAYLFTGSRGTGKTTCAKIFAKAINCLSPSDGNPCNECEMCRAIDAGSVLDIVEIDAASNRSIDDIRLLKDEANFMPTQARYRVYIIDEVHMLTIEAFNALLKILEEPPEHVKFVLATTEVHKLPATILSRCQRFDFRRIESADIAERLLFIASAEGAELAPDAAMLIARVADGGMRDALSILDRCISVSNAVSIETVSSSVGLTDSSHIYSLARAISAGDTAEALLLLDELHKGSCDTERLCAELIEKFRGFLIVKTVKNPEELLICAAEELKEIKKTADSFTKDAVLFALSVLTSAAEAMRKTQNRRIEMEMALIRLCNPRNDESSAGLAARIAALENEIRRLNCEGVKQPAEQPQPMPAAVKEPKDDKEQSPQRTKEAFPEKTPQEKPFAGFENENTESSFADEFNKDNIEGVGNSSDTGTNVDDVAGNEFDFDAFMREHSPEKPSAPVENTRNIITAYDLDDDAPPLFDDGDSPPFDDDHTVPFEESEVFSGSGSRQEMGKPALSAPAWSAAAADGKAVPPEKWKKIIYETENLFRPLIGQLTDSSARIVGNNLYIRLADKKMKIFLNEAVLGHYVSQAAKLVLGTEYSIKIEKL